METKQIKNSEVLEVRGASRMKKIDSRLEKSKKIEEDTLYYLSNKKDKKVTLQEIEMTSIQEYFMSFLGCIKNFKIIKKTYIREAGHLVTVFSK